MQGTLFYWDCLLAAASSEVCNRHVRCLVCYSTTVHPSCGGEALEEELHDLLQLDFKPRQTRSGCEVEGLQLGAALPLPPGQSVLQHRALYCLQSSSVLAAGQAVLVTGQAHT